MRVEKLKPREMRPRQGEGISRLSSLPVRRVAHISGASNNASCPYNVDGEKPGGAPGLALFETWDSTNVSRLGFC